MREPVDDVRDDRGKRREPSSPPSIGGRFRERPADHVGAGDQQEKERCQSEEAARHEDLDVVRMKMRDRKTGNGRAKIPRQPAGGLDPGARQGTQREHSQAFTPHRHAPDVRTHLLLRYRGGPRCLERHIGAIEALETCRLPREKHQLQGTDEDEHLDRSTPALNDGPASDDGEKREPRPATRRNHQSGAADQHADKDDRSVTTPGSFAPARDGEAEQDDHVVSKFEMSAEEPRRHQGGTTAQVEAEGGLAESLDGGGNTRREPDVLQAPKRRPRSHRPRQQIIDAPVPHGA